MTEAISDGIFYPTWGQHIIIVRLMSMQRRLFLKQISFVSFGSYALLKPHIGYSTPAERLVSEHEPEARAIHYLQDSQHIDSTAFDFYVEGSHCGNCRFFNAKGDGQFGHCKMYFPTRFVQSKGWCVGWTKKS